MAIIHGKLKLDVGPNRAITILKPIDVLSLGNVIKLTPEDVTDLSSIPFWARPLFFWADVALAGAVHDKLFRTGQVGWWEANQIWYDVAVSGDNALPKWKAALGFIGLTLGSWVPWIIHRAND